MSFLTGSKKSESGNNAFPFLQSSFGETSKNLVNAGQSGLAQYMNTLTGQDGGAGFEQFRNSTGYQNIFDEAMRGVTGSQAARGLLASGSTGRALQGTAGQLANQSFGGYLQHLLQGSQAQFGAGQGLLGNITNAGQFSKSEEKPGLGGMIGGLAKGVGSIAGKLGIAKLAPALLAFSDPDLKTDAKLLHREPDGLGIYEFRYKWDEPTDPVRVGVMADEVAELRPWALGSTESGYHTVDYGKL